MVVVGVGGGCGSGGAATTRDPASGGRPRMDPSPGRPPLRDPAPLPSPSFPP
uniref:Uncharacterized protein n=1 Tax=Oryza nivara TaxID=4536 RepID=A0A0E0IE13_ORYNI